MATFSSNVSEPLVLRNLVTAAVPVQTAGSVLANRAINSNGAYPSVGGYALGIVTQDIDGAGVANVATDTIEIIQVAPGSAIALDGEVSVNAVGRAIPAVAGHYVIGRAMDSAANTGTELRPFYIRVKLSGYKTAA